MREDEILGKIREKIDRYPSLKALCDAEGINYARARKVACKAGISIRQMKRGGTNTTGPKADKPEAPKAPPIPPSPPGAENGEPMSLEDFKRMRDEERVARKEVLIQKLDAAWERQKIVNVSLTGHDILASDPTRLAEMIMFELTSYLDAHSVNDRGRLTDFTDEATYAKVRELLNDINDLLIIRNLKKNLSQNWHDIPAMNDMLLRLLRKYSARTGRRITNSLELLSAMKEEALKILPELKSQVTMLTATSSRAAFGGYFQPFIFGRREEKK